MSLSRGKPRLSRRAALRTLGLGAAGLGLAATSCMPGEPRPAAPSGDVLAGPAVDFSARFADFEPADEPNAGLTKVVWPAFVTRGGPDVRRLYEFQIENGDLMKYMPCFCGCGKDDGHRSNRDCYVKAVNVDGSVALDSMAPT